MEKTIDYSEKNLTPYEDISDVLKIVAFVFFMLVFGTIFSIIGIIIAGLFSGIQIFPLAELLETSSVNTHSEIIIQLFSAFGAFIAPAFVYAKLFESNPKTFFKISKRPSLKIVVFTIVIFILANFVLDILVKASHLIPFESFNSNFFNSLIKTEELTETAFKRFLDFSSPLNFVAIFFMMAVIPALGEELTFRGVFFNLSHRSSKNLVFAILFSGFIFALIHFQLHNFLAIFFMGALLAYIYYLTENLWISIIAHLFNNGMIVVLSYANKLGFMDYDFAETEDIPLLVSIFGSLIFLSAFYFYRKVVLEEKQKQYE